MSDWGGPLCALLPESDLPIRILAVVGAGSLGALFIGWTVQAGVKLAFAQQVPRWPMWGIRTLGGILCGWLIYLWLFGSGAGGLGGPGGWFGGGKGGSDGNDGKAVPKKDKDKKDKDKDTKDKSKDKDGKSEAPPEQTLRIEVLGDAPLKKLGKTSPMDRLKRYRLAGDQRLYTLDALRKLILKRREGTPPLRELVVVVYLDSPARERPQVADLVDWARDLEPERGVKVNVYEADRYAPVD